MGADRSVAAAGEGLLLVGHGTRDRQGVEEFLAVAAQVAQRAPHLVVEAGFLELAEPTIAQALEQCARRGARRVTVKPLLLFSAGHDQRDIPHAVTQAAECCPRLALNQAEHVGRHPNILELSSLRFEEAVASRSPVPLSETLLLLVGRGSSDADATAETFRFTELRRGQSGVGRAETCFAALASPRLSEMLPQVAAMPFRRVVVQPHLLFQGQLLDRVNQQVTDFAHTAPRQEWIVTGHLGPHALLCDAILAGLM